MVIMNYDNMMI